MKSIALINNVQILVSEDIVLMGQIAEALGLDVENHVSAIEFKSIRKKAADFKVFGQSGTSQVVVAIPVYTAIEWVDLLNVKGDDLNFKDSPIKNSLLDPDAECTTLTIQDFYRNIFEIMSALKSYQMERGGAQ